MVCIALWCHGTSIFNSGSIYLFDCSDSANCFQVAKTANNGAASDRFGFSVSLSDAMAFVGSHGKDRFSGCSLLFSGLPVPQEELPAKCRCGKHMATNNEWIRGARSIKIIPGTQWACVVNPPPEAPKDWVTVWRKVACTCNCLSAL